MSSIPTSRLMLEFPLQHLHHVVIWPKSPPVTEKTVCPEEINFIIVQL